MRDGLLPLRVAILSSGIQVVQVIPPLLMNLRRLKMFQSVLGCDYASLYEVRSIGPSVGLSVLS